MKTILGQSARSVLQSWIDDELTFHSTVTQSAADATLEGVGAWRLRDKFNGCRLTFLDLPAVLG
jgi:hypothetical protein